MSQISEVAVTELVSEQLALDSSEDGTFSSAQADNLPGVKKLSDDALRRFSSLRRPGVARFSLGRLSQRHPQD